MVKMAFPRIAKKEETVFSQGSRPEKRSWILCQGEEKWRRGKKSLGEPTVGKWTYQYSQSESMEAFGDKENFRHRDF
jgi:hypothetical protein